MTEVSDLELSVRAQNALRMNDILTIEQFLNLNRATVMSWDNIGVRSWMEIAQAQEYLRGPSPAEREAMAFDEARHAIGVINRFLKTRHRAYRVNMTREGILALYRRVG